jgi:hypothetical protein
LSILKITSYSEVEKIDDEYEYRKKDGECHADNKESVGKEI